MKLIPRIKERVIKALGGITEEECLVIGSTLYKNNQENLDQIRRLREQLKNTSNELENTKARVQDGPSSVEIKKENRKLQSELRSLQAAHQKLKIQKEQKIKKTNKSIPDQSRLKAWSKRVRAVGKCDCCSGTNKLTAHHLWDKNTHGSLMYQDENGVCLCLACHNKFHAMFTSKSQVTPKLYQIFKQKEQNETIKSKK